ncbi:MAG TPA: hypothetical protein VK081_07610 [Planctomycetota bacterium]|nr:hypothetical protein [Planctomycetota bacterium]
MLRWLQRKSEDGIVHGEVLYQEARALQQRVAVSPLSSSGPTNWALLGPGNIGGRIRSILIHPNDPSVMWIGSVSGGVWKTTNGGTSWTMLPDLPAVLAVSCMAMHPSQPDVLYAGTGEQCFFVTPEGSSNSAVNFGAGVFKSTDGGMSWTQLPATSGPLWTSVSRIAIDPNDPTVLLASTISGIWRSSDGGATWSRRTTAKALDVDFHPFDSSRCVAGRADGVAMYSTDGGVTWNNAPAFPGATRIEVAYARSAPDTVYAAVTVSGALRVWRSTNGGQTYTQRSGNNVVSVLGIYTGALWVDPTNADRLVVGGLDLYRSTNGGTTFTKFSAWASYPNSAHADHHVIVHHPQFNGGTNNTVFFGNDGGIQRTTNVYTATNTSGWTNLARGLAITQLYGCCINPTTGVVLAGAQDNGTVRGAPANGLNGWTSPLGGDGSYCAADPNDPNVFYLQYYFLNLYRSTNGGATAGQSIRNGISEPDPNFMAYILLDPNDSNRLYACGAQLWRTNNARTGNPPAWSAIKPALPCPIAGGGGQPTPDHYLDNPPCNISTVAVARGNPNVIWVGHNNGALYYTTSGLAATPLWIKVDDNAPGLPDRWVSRIVIDPDDHRKVTVSFMGFAPDNVWRTTDSGATWSPRVGSGAGALPAVPVSCIVQHRVSTSRFYAATDLGLFFSEDDGLTWQPAAGGPSIVPIDELVWRNDRTLIVATHGRSVWSCDVDPASVTPVGNGCGVVGAPSLTVAPPVIGASHAYTLANAAPNAPVALLLAAGPPAPTPFGPCVVQPALGGLVSLSVGSTTGAGGLVFQVPIPAHGALNGAVLTVQEFIAVPGGPLLGAGELSNGAQLTLGF